jgi:hypothetical protein
MVKHLGVDPLLDRCSRACLSNCPVPRPDCSILNAQSSSNDILLYMRNIPLLLTSTESQF